MKVKVITQDGVKDINNVEGVVFGSEKCVICFKEGAEIIPVLRLVAIEEDKGKIIKSEPTLLDSVKSLVGA